MQQSDLGTIVASGHATPDQWNDYWSAYALDVDRELQKREQHETEIGGKRFPHNLRQWLRKNKVFFDTVTASTLSLMAIFLSYAGYRQTTMQTRIQAVQLLPLLFLKSDQIQDPKTQLYAEHRVTISNLGTPVRNFSTFVRSVAIIEVMDRSGNREPDIILPLSMYFTGDFETHDGRGLLATYTGGTNNLKSAELRRYTLHSGWLVNIRIVHLFTLNFVDLLGDSHRSYFRVDDVSAGIELTEEEAARWKSAYYPMDIAGRNFTEISGVEVVKRIADAEAARGLKDTK